MKRLLYICAAMLLFSGCVGLGGPVVKSHSFILGFYEPETIASNAEYIEVDGAGYARVNVYISKGKRVTDVFRRDKAGKRMFDDLCKKYNDVSAPRRVLASVNDCYMPNYFSYPTSDFNRIDIASGSAWDAQHPAGSSLNDITDFVGLSAYPYIRDSYRKLDYSSFRLSKLFHYVFDDFYSGDTDWDIAYYNPIDKKVDELSADDIMLLGTGRMHSCVGYAGFTDCGYVYNPTPVHETIQNLFSLFLPLDDVDTGEARSFTVRLTDSDGREYVTSVELPAK